MMLRVENLDVFYGDVQALDSVSLDVAEGAIVAIVGANGAGKTTLIRALRRKCSRRRAVASTGASDMSRWPSHQVCNSALGEAGGRAAGIPYAFRRLKIFYIGAMLPRARALRAKNRERVLAMFPKFGGAVAATGGNTFRRRAADARHRPLPDGRRRN